MIITTPTLPFIYQQSAPVSEPPKHIASPQSDTDPTPLEQTLSRSKRSLFVNKGRGVAAFFGSRPPVDLPRPPALLPSPSLPRIRPRPDLTPSTSLKPGTSFKPRDDRFKDMGQAVIHANRVKANDDVLMANLRKHSPVSVAEATKRLIDAENLVKSGVISTGPKASRVARDAFISAGVTGLVSAPINVAAYAGSTATGEMIKAQYAPGVLPPPYLASAASQAKVGTQPVQAQSTPGPTDPFAKRLDDVESNVLGMASAVMFVLGDSGSVFTKDAQWPKEQEARLTNVEKLLDTAAQQLKKASRQNGIIFKPYKPRDEIPKEAGARLELVEKKLAHMTDAFDKLRVFAAVKQSESQHSGSVTA